MAAVAIIPKVALLPPQPASIRSTAALGPKQCQLPVQSRAYREGVEINQVNPAYSSVIGRAKFMERYGLSVHQAAALVLARRLLGCPERVPRRRVCPVGNGVQVAFTVPARKRVKHVWTHWGAILGQLKPALAAQHRLGKRKREPNPVAGCREG